MHDLKTTGRIEDETVHNTRSGYHLKRIERSLSMLLIASMVLTGVPFGERTAEAAVDNAYDVFDALGIDKEAEPDGYESGGRNPYGAASVQVMPVAELLTVSRIPESTDPEGDPEGEIIPERVEAVLYGHEAAIGIDMGIFRGTGRTPWELPLYDGYNAVSGDFTGEGLEKGLAVLTAELDAETNALSRLNLHFADPAAASVSETVKTFVPGEADAFGKEGTTFTADSDRLHGFLQVATGDFTGDGVDEIALYIPEPDTSRIEIYKLEGTDWTNPADWDVFFSRSVACAGEVPDMVDLTAADVTADGIDDLVVTWGMEGANGQSVMLHGSRSGTLPDETVLIPLTGGLEIGRAATAFGDVDFDGRDELVLGGQLTAEMNRGGTRYLATCEYDGEADAFVMTATGNISLPSGDPKPSAKADLAVVKLDGPSTREYVYLDGFFFLQNGSGFGIGGGAGYLEGRGARGADLDGDGRERVVTCAGGDAHVLNLSGSEVFDGVADIALPNTDRDTSVIKYNNRHHLVYSDPKILAVLASPPYFKDLEHLEGGDAYVGNATTSYGTIEGSSSSKTSSSTISAGGYVSFEQEFSFFGFSAASVEAETEFSHAWTRETEEISSRTQTIEYGTVGGQDTVAIYAIPIDIYEYTLYTPGDSPGEWESQIMNVSIPYSATVRTLTLDYYDRIARYYDELPIIGGTVLKHTPGDPGTYPSSTAGYTDVNEPDGSYIGVDFGSSYISQTLELTEESSVGVSQTNSISTKVGGGAGGVTAGVTAGWEGGSGSVETSLDGKFFSSTIVNMPEEARDYGYNYSVKMFQYTHNGTQNFPVVNYTVKDVNAPGELPGRVEIDTTSDSVTLSWEAGDREGLAGYQVYRHYVFPDGEGDYLVGDMVTAGTDGRFVFTDTDLAPYTEYAYRIQSVSMTAPYNSVKSDVVTVRTRAAEGQPDIALSNIVGGKLTVYPDETPGVIAIVTNDAENAGTPIYQWQKKDGDWTNLVGKTSNTLVFSSSVPTDEGLYRVRVNQFVGSQAISAYSEAFEVVFEKRDMTFGEIRVLPDGEAFDISVTLDRGESAVAPSGNVTFEITGDDYKKTQTVAIYTEGEGASASIEDWAAPGNGVYSLTAYYSGNRIFNSGLSEAKRYLVGDSEGYALDFPETDIVYGGAPEPLVTRFFATEEGQATETVEAGGGLTFEDAYDKKDGFAWIPVGSDAPESVGVYRLSRDLVVDESTVASLEGVFSIVKKPVVVTAPDVENQRNLAVWPELDETMVVPGLVNGDTISGLGLFVRCLDGSGRETSDFDPASDSDPLPGLYATRIKADSARADAQANYEFTFEDGTYTVIGLTYPVACEAEPLLDEIVGTVSIVSPEDHEDGTQYQQNTELMFRAAPYEGYEVDQWTQNGSPVVLDEGANPNLLMASMPVGGLDVSVSFKVKEVTLSFGGENGTVECVSLPTLASGDKVMKGGSYTFKAIPDAGWHFKEWNKNDGVTSQKPDGGTDPEGFHTCEVAIGDSSVSLTAVFERDSYLLETEGQVSAWRMEDGDRILIVSGDVVPGDSVVTVEPAAGHLVVADEDTGAWAWSSTAEGVVSEDGQSYTFTMTENTLLSAETERQRYSIEFVEDPAGEEANTYTAEADGQAIEIPWGSSLEMEGGADLVLEAQPAYGVLFDHWTVEEGEAVDVVSEPVLTLSGLSGNLRITAHFVSNNAYTVTLPESLHGHVEASLNGTPVDIPENRELSVFEGDNLAFTAVPDTGYMVGVWTVDGIRTQTSNPERSLEDITGDHSVAVEFTALVYYDILFAGDENGTVGALKDGDILVGSGDVVGGGAAITFTASPAEGYMIESWTLNGETVLNDLGEVLVSETLEIDPLVEDIDLAAAFEPRAFHDIVTTPVEGASWSVAVDPDEFDGALRDGAALTLALTPDENHRVKAMTVDTTSFSALETSADGTWTGRIHCVEAGVTADAETVPLYEILIGETDNGSASSEPVKAEEGETVAIAAGADAGWRFTRWTAVDGDGEAVELANADKASTTFVMGDSPVTVTPGFARQSGGGGGGLVMPEVTDPIADALDAAEVNEEGKTVAKIKVDEKNEDDQYVQEIPKSFFEEADKILEIETPDGTVALPDAMFDQEPEEDVSIGISRIDPDTLELSEEDRKLIEGKPVIDINLFVGGEKIKWKSGKEKIRISIPYEMSEEEKADPHRVTAVFIDDDGNILPLTNSKYDPETGSLVFETNHTSCYAAAFSDKTFEDMEGFAWAEEAVEALAARGVVNGMDAERFAPGDSIRRADFVLLMVKFLGLEADSEENFTDVAPEAYYHDAVGAAKALGIVNGTGGGFLPVEAVSRQDMMVILQRALSVSGMDDGLEGDSGKRLDAFEDASEVAGYARDSVDALIRKGVVSGDGAMVHPADSTRRAEVAALLYKLLGQLK